MNILVILAIGATLGWLASRLTRTLWGPGLVANVAVGMAGALVSGAMASSTAMLEGMTAQSIGGTLVGTALLLGAVNMAWRTARPAQRKAPPAT